MKWHKAAAIFPMMTEADLNSLADDIATNGLISPIVVDPTGSVIDGRNRYLACQIAKVTPKTVEFTETDPEKIAAFVWSMNSKRRHLEQSQRDAAGVNMEEYVRIAKAESLGTRNSKLKKGAVKNVLPLVSADTNGKPKKQDDSKRTAAKVAKQVGSSPASIARAQAVKDRAPDLFKKMEGGEVKTNSAYNELRKREKLATLEQKAKEVEFESDQPLWTLINQDVMDGLQSVLENHAKPRLVFADPPYNVGVDYGNGENADKKPMADYLQWAAEWVGKCHDLLTDDGSLWLMINDEYAAEYAAIIKRTGFRIRSWIKWYETFGVNCSNNFNRTSRHIFYAVKHPLHFVFNADAVMRPSDRQTKYGDKRAVEGGKIWDDVWQISRLTGTCDERMPSFPTQLPLALVEPIVLCASDPGDLVLDPFNGSGTTGEAAIRNKRKYVGIDQSEQFIDLAGKRLATGGMRHAV